MGWFGRLRARYSGKKGHAFGLEGGSAISRPRSNGNVDVILVDEKGTYIKSLARDVKPSLGDLIIKRRHG